MIGDEARRRLLHVGSAAVLIVVPVGSWELLRLVLGVGAALALVVELARLRWPAVRHRVEGLVPMFRPAEAHALSGATWLCLGYAAAAWLAPQGAASGILVGACADPAAAAVGSRGAAGDAKTWSGSLAHFVVATAVLALIGAPVVAVLTGAAVGTAVERWPGVVNDNLLVAPAVGAVVVLFA